MPGLETETRPASIWRVRGLGTRPVAIVLQSPGVYRLVRKTRGVVSLGSLVRTPKGFTLSISDTTGTAPLRMLPDGTIHMGF